jgi:hypothetical protein
MLGDRPLLHAVRTGACNVKAQSTTPPDIEVALGVELQPLYLPAAGRVTPGCRSSGPNRVHRLAGTCGDRPLPKRTWLTAIKKVKGEQVYDHHVPTRTAVRLDYLYIPVFT